MLSAVVRRVRVPEVRPSTADDPPEIGGYEIRGRLGQGGMGVVYLGATRSGRLLAIKVIHPERTGESEFRTRFRREVSAATRVRSRRTAAVVDFDVDAATPWLAIEYVAGPTLAQAIAELGSLPEEAVRELVAGLAEALDAVHREGLVHRDVKPTNVLLGPDGPVLIDLGVVADSDATSLTTTGVQPGTPQFMSPEQARGEAVTTATDVWSLGAVTHLAATGTPPFGTGSLATVTYRIVHEPPALDAVPPGLRGLVAACLAKDAGARPTTAAVLASVAHLPYVEAEVTGLTSSGLAGADTVLGAASAPGAASSDPPPTPGRIRRQVLTGLVALGLVLVGGGAAAALVHFLGPDDTPTTPQAAGSAPAEPSATPSPSPSAEEPSQKPSASPSAPAATPVDEQDAGPAEEEQAAALAQFRPGTVSIPAQVQVGQKITAWPKGWTPQPASTACVWSIGGEERDNLGSCSYTVALGDVGKPVQVRLTATRSGYAEAAVLSDATGTVPQPSVPQPSCSVRMDPGKVNSGWMTYCEVDQDPDVTYTWSWVDVTRDETIRWGNYPPGRRIWIGGGRAGHQARVTVTAEREGYRSAEFGTNFTLPDEWVPAG
ncbi:serine/threonine-protein kinase [Promicromonospora sp. MEB111]|uniref:serine/threonine-protein kinase n=1 Tax=Promicromonospora sp. MEB111 TaxID=3040301 RepID=UPI00254C06AC|nr:serine/threonine-protein kinase [Promicromonospora sp. MEB111]